jgi:hypothetical protein
VPSLNPPAKSPYKFAQYIYGPRSNRVHLDAGDPPVNPLLNQQSNYLPGEEGSFGPPESYLPMPGEEGNPGPIGPPRAAPSAPPTDSTSPLDPRYTGAVSKYEELLSQYPTKGTPNWWQRVAAGALGGLAGWSNAASRTKHPIDIGATTQGILYPGYEGQLQSWLSRVQPVQQEMTAEAARQNAELKGEQIAGQKEQREASAQWRTAQASPHYGRTQLDPAYARENFPWLTPDANGEYWVPNTVANTMSKPTPAEKPTMTVTDPDLAKVLGVKPGTEVPTEVYKTAVSANSKQAPNRNVMEAYIEAAGGDTAKALQHYQQDQVALRAVAHPGKAGKGGGGQKPPTGATLAGIEARKGTRLNQLSAQANAAALKQAGDPEAVQAIWENFRNQRQSIQDEYEGEVAAATGVAQPHFAYDAPKPPSASTAPPPAPPTPPNGAAAGATTGAAIATPPAQSARYTEAQVRDAAVRAGKNADAAVAAARAKGLIP